MRGNMRTAQRLLTVAALTVAAAVATVVPIGLADVAHADSSRGGAIGRTEMLNRAQDWVNRGITYTQSASASDVDGAHTYRRDCSGFVSMAWHYGSSLITNQFLDKARSNDGMHVIAFDDLRAGDAMVRDADGSGPDGHIELFSHWVSSGNHRQGAYVYSFNSSGETVRNPYAVNNKGLLGQNSDSEMREYTPIRYNSVVETQAPTGDFPVAGDFDGDGTTQVGIWRPREGRFHLRAADGSVQFVSWGGPGDIPVIGDWDGDGRDDVGIFRPSEGRFHLAGPNGASYASWGGAGDYPVAGDFDGDGKDEPAIWRPSEGRFHLPGGPTGIQYVWWGGLGDIPVIGDWNSDHRDDVGIFRPSEGRFHLAGPNGTSYVSWGGSGDLPVIGNWDGTGAVNVGIWRTSEARFHLNLDNGGIVYQYWGEPR